jgi:hypothetical protein
MLRQGKVKQKPGWHPIQNFRRARVIECLELFLRKSPARYGVRFDKRRNQREFAYSWAAIICKN